MILCVGTTPAVQRTMTFERVVPDAVNRAVEVREFASGKSINVARVLTTLGKKSLAMGFAGGHRGDDLQSDMDAAHIKHDFVAVTPQTRLCMSVIDKAQGHATELIEEAGTVTEADVDALLTRIEDHVKAAQVAVLSGSLAPGVPVGFYRRCADLLKAAGAKVIVDARGPALTDAIAGGIDVVKPNREELAATVGRELRTDDDVASAASELIAAGARLVVVTMGKRGCVATDGKQRWRVPAPVIVTVNAVGSGDAFAAGLAAALLDDLPTEVALRHATAAACANAMTPFPGHVLPDDVAALFERVTVRISR